MTEHLTDVDQLPSKERSRPKRDSYPLDIAGDLQFHRALCSWQYDEIQRLREDLRRTESARVALLAENEHYKRRVEELSIHAEKWVQRALTPAHEREPPHCSTCECWAADRAAQPPRAE